MQAKYPATSAPPLSSLQIPPGTRASALLCPAQGAALAHALLEEPDSSMLWSLLQRWQPGAPSPTPHAGLCAEAQPATAGEGSVFAPLRLHRAALAPRHRDNFFLTSANAGLFPYGLPPCVGMGCTEALCLPQDRVGVWKVTSDSERSPTFPIPPFPSSTTALIALVSGLLAE